MNGIQIEYLLGLYFAIKSLGTAYEERTDQVRHITRRSWRITVNWLIFIIGNILIMLAVLGINPIR